MQDELLMEVAHLYYEMNLTQQEIADKIFVSRSRISRMLAEAREKGIVEVTVHYSYEKHIDVERVLKEKFNIEEACIVNSEDLFGKEAFDRVCKMAADYLVPRLSNQTVLSLWRGRTIQGVVRHLNPLRMIPDMRVIQLAGSVEQTYNPHFEEMDMVREVAMKFGCDCRCLMAPLIVENRELRDMIASRPVVREVMDMVGDVNLLCTSVSSLSQWENRLSEKELNSLKRQKAVGCFEGYFYDINGNIIDTPIYKRFIFPDRRVFDIPRRICITADVFKTKALLGALRGGFITTLITETKDALRVLNANDKV